MTVKELIQQLQEIENKSKPVFVWFNGERIPVCIEAIDELNDCVDINIA